MVCGLGCGAWGFVLGFEFLFWGLGFRVWGLEFRKEGPGFKI